MGLEAGSWWYIGRFSWKSGHHRAWADGGALPRWAVGAAVDAPHHRRHRRAGRGADACHRHGAGQSLAGWPPAIFFFCAGGGVFAQVYRYARVSGPVQRQQTKWVVFGFAVAFWGRSYSRARSMSSGLAQPTRRRTGVHLLAGGHVSLSALAHPAVDRRRDPALPAVGHRPHHQPHAGLRRADRRASSGSTCSSSGRLGALFQAREQPRSSRCSPPAWSRPLPAAARRLQRGVNRLMYGERDEPYAVLSRLGQRLEATLAPEAVLPTIVETVAQALKLPYAAIALKRDDGFEVAAAATDAPPASRWSLPLVYQDETVGQLLLCPARPARPSRPPTGACSTTSPARRRRRPRRAPHRRPAALARAAGHAREEERRRLRRDLHDGLGPTLASLTLRLDAARELLATDPARPRRCSPELKAQTQAPSPTSGAWSTICARRPSTTSAWSPAIREQAAKHGTLDPGDAAGRRPTTGWRLGRGAGAAAAAAGRRGGGRLPHRPGGADQRRRATPGRAAAGPRSRSTRPGSALELEVDRRRRGACRRAPRRGGPHLDARARGGAGRDAAPSRRPRRAARACSRGCPLLRRGGASTSGEA